MKKYKEKLTRFPKQEGTYLVKKIAEDYYIYEYWVKYESWVKGIYCVLVFRYEMQTYQKEFVEILYPYKEIPYSKYVDDIYEINKSIKLT